MSCTDRCSSQFDNKKCAAVLAFEAHRLCVSLDSRREGNTNAEVPPPPAAHPAAGPPVARALASVKSLRFCDVTRDLDFVKSLCKVARALTFVKSLQFYKVTGPQSLATFEGYSLEAAHLGKGPCEALGQLGQDEPASG